MKKVHIYIDGMVNAVGFRNYVKRHADTLGLKGYVRNSEGGVEVVAEGQDALIEQLVDLCRRGPSSARVTDVNVEEYEPSFLYTDFVIRP